MRRSIFLSGLRIPRSLLLALACLTMPMTPTEKAHTGYNSPLSMVMPTVIQTIVLLAVRLILNGQLQMMASQSICLAWTLFAFIRVSSSNAVGLGKYPQKYPMHVI